MQERESYSEQAVLAARESSFDTAGETKVTDFKVTIGVQEKIGRLKITVNDISTMDSLQSTKSLVDEVLDKKRGQ